MRRLVTTALLAGTALAGTAAGGGPLFTEKMTVPPGAGGFAGASSNASFRVKVARGTQIRADVPRSQVRPYYLAAYSTIETAR